MDGWEAGRTRLARVFTTARAHHRWWDVFSSHGRVERPSNDTHSLWAQHLRHLSTLYSIVTDGARRVHEEQSGLVGLGTRGLEQ